MMGCQSMGCKMKHMVLSRRIHIYKYNAGAVGIGAMVIFIIVVSIISLLGDILYAMLDPRIVY